MPHIPFMSASLSPHGHLDAYDVEQRLKRFLNRLRGDLICSLMRRKNPKQVFDRWHPKYIGVISVKIDADWYEVPATDPALESLVDLLRQR